MPAPTPNRPIRGALPVMLCLAVAGGVSAAQDSGEDRVGLRPSPDQTARLIDDLGAGDFATRSAAERALRTPGVAALADIESALRNPEISAEQRLRLETVGRELFAAVPKAGLGVRFGNPGAVEDGVPLAGVVEGFPAAEVLRPGDVIITINGQPVANQTHMGALILSHLPGESLHVVLDRPVAGPEVDPAAPQAAGRSERLTLQVPLGRYEDLQTGIELTPSRLGLAYSQRLARQRADSPGLPVIGGGLTPAAWLSTEGYDAERALAPESRLQPVTAWRIFAFAGQPSAELASTDLRRGDSTAMRTRANRALRANGIYDQIEEALAGYRALAHRLTQIRDELGRTASDTDDPTRVRRQRALQAETADIERTLEDIRDLFEKAAPGVQADAPTGERTVD